MKQAMVWCRGRRAGTLTEDENGYTFVYDADYLASADAEAVSLTLPLSSNPYRDKVLFPFFDGLIPEGWLLDIARKKRRLKKTDFITAMQASGLDDKVIENTFNRFLRVKDKWFSFIDISFLPDTMKEMYKGIIEEKLRLLK